MSKVLADDKMGISGSYDASIILWDLGSKTVSERLIGPHKEAIMDFEWKNSLLISGDKSGVVAIWVYFAVNEGFEQMQDDKGSEDT